MNLLDGDIDARNEVYKELIRKNNGDMSYDWFQEIYETELSERKQKKQDFTPNILGVLCSNMTSQSGSIHEPTAGNGSMIIADWWERCRKKDTMGTFSITEYDNMLGIVCTFNTHSFTQLVNSWYDGICLSW